MPPNSTGNTTPEVCMKKVDSNVPDGSHKKGEAASNVASGHSNDFQELHMTNSLPTGKTTIKPSTTDDSITQQSLITLDSIKHHTIPGTNVIFKDKSIDRERLYCSGCHKFMLKPWIVQCGHNICTKCKEEGLMSGEGVCVAIEDGHRCNTHFNESQVRIDRGLLRDMKSIEIACPNKEDGCDATVHVSVIEEHLVDCVATKPKMPSLEEIQTDLMLKSSQSGKLNGITGMASVSILQFMSVLTCVKNLTTKVDSIESENTTLKHKQAELQSENTNLKTKVGHLEQNMQKVDEENKKLQSKVRNLEEKVTKLETQRGKTESNGLTVAAHGQIQGQLKKLGQQTTLHDITLNELDVRMQCVESATYDGKMIWKISQFSEHLDRAKKGQTLSLFSQPFYAGNRGYKMCGRVYLNGDGSGKGSHISFFFVLMRGTYDDLLQWPFQQKITLGCKDVNNNSSNDIRESFNPSDKSQSFKKPISEMNVASGCPQFVSHANMNRYVKNDTIYLYLEIDMLGLEQMQQEKQVQLTTTRNTGTRK